MPVSEPDRKPNSHGNCDSYRYSDSNCYSYSYSDSNSYGDRDTNCYANTHTYWHAGRLRSRTRILEKSS